MKPRIWIATLIIMIMISVMIHMAIALKPTLYLTDKYTWYIYIGDIHMKNSRTEGALSYYTKATESDNEREAAHLRKAMIYWAFFMPKEVQKEISYLDTDSIPFNTYNAKINLHKGNLTATNIYLDKAMGSKGCHQHPFLISGILSLKENDPKAAVDFFQKGLDESCIDLSVNQKYFAGILEGGLWIAYTRLNDKRAQEQYIKANLTNSLMKITFERVFIDKYDVNIPKPPIN